MADKTKRELAARKAIERVMRSHGAVLIFDEMVVQFRMAEKRMRELAEQAQTDEQARYFIGRAESLARDVQYACSGDCENIGPLFDVP